MKWDLKALDGLLLPALLLQGRQKKLLQDVQLLLLVCSELPGPGCQTLIMKFNPAASQRWGDDKHRALSQEQRITGFGTFAGSLKKILI